MITTSRILRPALMAVAGAFVVALLASCASSPAPGSTSSPGSSPATSSAPGSGGPGSSPAPGASAATSGALGSCPTSGLHTVVNTVPGGGAAGTVYVAIDFTNVSGRTCTMTGFPGVSFVTGHPGQQIGAAATRQTTFPSETVTLPAGGNAHAWLGIADAGNYSPSACRPVTARIVRVYPPDQFAAVYASFTATVCSANVTTGTPLLILPVRAGQATAQHVP